MRSLFGPRTTNGHKLTLTQQVVQTVRGLQPCEAGRKRCPRSHMPAATDHPHPRCRTKLCHLLANPTGADNADRLVPNYDRFVTLMIKAATLLVPVTQMKATGEV